jgi:hypothetical protein
VTQNESTDEIEAHGENTVSAACPSGPDVDGIAACMGGADTPTG